MQDLLIHAITIDGSNLYSVWICLLNCREWKAYKQYYEISNFLYA